jgi:hypothetical protein
VVPRCVTRQFRLSTICLRPGDGTRYASIQWIGLRAAAVLNTVFIAYWVVFDRLYLFGGLNSDSTKSLADLWRIETRPGATQLYWAFLAGTTTAVTISLHSRARCRCSSFDVSQNSPGFAGLRGLPHSANFPAARWFHATTMDDNDNLLLFGSCLLISGRLRLYAFTVCLSALRVDYVGGETSPPSTFPMNGWTFSGLRNDFWKFMPSSGLWVW